MGKSKQANDMPKKNLLSRLSGMSDTNLLLTITIVVFFVMYIGAIVF